ncbi:eIF-2-alpha kinase GCN2-like isoform X1 [Chenopodium quinoa]|uniref:eIF-2-alpha kinase GCN2-like isoform X1 n=3 Tax=Chenopodium quinoa TaxID=63459 RepID=UPI000B7701DF|nr:eIF-2-alpha kinase GCN2-like isoform X1 [Chenopodium quinoa]XP_021721683.1 eIF-2-alpha kinase GCN2-like isoform X1 [Chenopodium quinoa]
MGQSSKKKKRRNKGRATTKDHALLSADYSELISEELTALSAIFQEDCQIVSDSHPQVSINIRPYSKDSGYENMDISVHLLVRCLPGYPYKCPKVQLTSEKGLSESDADRLLMLLHEQANSNAREGRVMIFNLVEAAQEFLSAVIPTAPLQSRVVSIDGDSIGQLPSTDVAKSSESVTSFKDSFVYGFMDLFSGYEESWKGGEISSSVVSRALSRSKQVFEGVEKNFKPKEKSKGEDNRHAEVVSTSTKLEYVKEVSEDDAKVLSTTSSNRYLSDDLAGSSSDEEIANKDTGDNSEGSLSSFNDTDDQETGSSKSSSVPLRNDQTSQSIKSDLIMAHLLRLACGSNGPLAKALPKLTSELYSLGIISEWTRDVTTNSPTLYSKTFDHVFHQHMASSEISEFWEPVSDIGGQDSSLPNSRYLNDFEELQSLGHGGFGHVVLCKNKLDGRQYALKMIRLKDKSPPVNDRILREVATLARLQHQHVVRYYQAWIETRVAGNLEDSMWGSKTGRSSSFSCMGGSLSDTIGQEDMIESPYLYIQMEYCPRTLRQLFDSYRHFDKELAWHLFRQIVEGLGHIHAQGIIHRDLTPNNIFFDARNDIKIGDFGLAKFLKLEQLDQETTFPSDARHAPGVSIDGTGQIGTYFYTAPEIEQGWPKIDEKADMYSLGVVFFELWHPFGTAMERHIVLSDLKQKGELPAAWVAVFPEQASLLRRLMSPIPADRPSAVELLQDAFPPRMEYELLDNFLRTMQTSEDTSVYDKVVGALFNEELLASRSSRLHHSIGDVTSVAQYSEVETELHDYVIDASKEVFKRHCAKHLKLKTLRLMDDFPVSGRGSIKLLSQGGDMVELSHELRLPFVKWATVNQKSSFKRYEISSVYRRAIGHAPPNVYLQGDFDIIGGASPLTEAEIIKATIDILMQFFNPDSLYIHLSHGNLLNAMWSWAGIKAEHRQKVAEILSMLGCLPPQSSERKSKWVLIRRQLLQEVRLPEAVVNRLQAVGQRFCGDSQQTLPRLRGALPADTSTRKALDEISDLLSYLRVWKIEKHIYIDSLMPPSEYYHRDLYFQIYLRKESSGSPIEGKLLALGGRYDYLLHQIWEREHRSSPPGAVGISLALETIIQHSCVHIKPIRSEACAGVLVCSKGGGGLLEERMEIVVELWEANIKAEYVPSSDPSLTEQYEYANEHDIKWLVVITDSGVSQKDTVKVRHLELKGEKEVERENLVRFLLEAMSSQFRSLSRWS